MGNDSDSDSTPLMLAVSASAQDAVKINERYFQAKVNELALRLEMTESHHLQFLLEPARIPQRLLQTDLKCYK